MAGRERCAVGRPHRVEVGCLRPLRSPAERGDVGIGRADRREQADRWRILCDGLALTDEDEVVDLGALEVDRALERRRDNAHARRRGENLGAGLERLRWCRGRRRLRLGLRLRLRLLGQRLRLAVDDLRRRRLGLREEAFGRPAPAEQDEGAQRQREDQVLAVVHVCLVPHGTGSGPWPPQGWQRRMRLRAIHPPRAAP